ncbi:MAG: D-alanyl-D-alanine carboxypeptidase [Chlamydiae bacterium]|nr:D-alanyl-D-alanine carboxypeptidase [Chlamydiota bacterium]
MRYLLLLLLLPSLMFAKTTANGPNFVAKPNLHSRYALLMDIDNGKVLYHKNGYERIFPASTTKIATVLYVITKYEEHLDDIVEVPLEILKMVTHDYKREQNYQLPPHLLQVDGTNLGIRKGEKLPLRLLVYACMMVSANDAANALAFHLEKDIPKFMEGLNAFLHSIGCKNTHFNNPHGLHHPDHYSTPYDMALLGKKASENRLFREIVLTEEYERTGTRQQKAFTIRQTNRLLKEGPYYYPFAFGLKTGHTDPALYNLVAAATNGQRNLVLALHKSDKISGCYRDAINLFDAFFAEEMHNRLLFGKDDVLFRTAVGKQPLKAFLQEDVVISYYLSEEPGLKTEVVWNLLYLPIKKGQLVGKLRVFDDDQRILVDAPLFSADAIAKPFSYIWLLSGLVALIFILLYRWIRSSKPISPSLSV